MLYSDPPATYNSEKKVYMLLVLSTESVPDLGQMRPLTWTLTGSRPGRPTQTVIMSGIAPKQNSFKFKIAPHKQKSIVKKKFGRKMVPCLSTPKKNGKSGTVQNTLYYVYTAVFYRPNPSL